MLHAYIEDISWIARHATNETGRARHGDEGGKRGLGKRGGEMFFELRVDPEAGSRVGQLTEEGGGETAIEA